MYVGNCQSASKANVSIDVGEDNQGGNVKVGR
jgi:hypothetical protein